MKRKQVSTIFILLVAGCLMAGCEKTTGCENYSPWPSSDAIAAWKEYSPNLVDSLDAYNDVATTGSYLGFYPSAYDSTVSIHDHDSILICGYLSLFQEYSIARVYYLTKNVPNKPFDRNQEEFITILIFDSVRADTTRQAYIRGMIYKCQATGGGCNDYCYYIKTTSELSPIKYDE